LRPVRTAQAVVGAAAIAASSLLPAEGATAATPATTAATTSATSGAPTLGVLAADPAHLAADKRAGIKTETILLHWNQAEPEQGQWDTSYLWYVQHIADQYRAAGMAVAVDPGLQHPPNWATALPNGTYVDQGGASTYLADFSWSQAVRLAGAAYLAKVVSTMGTVVDYRLGMSENGETMYPDSSDNQWWAYTPSAQGSALGLPAGLLPSPMPGWVPGTSTWHGLPVTVTQASDWYDWYFSGLVSQLRWQIATYRAAGYLGQLELVLPGMGSLPAFYQERLDHLLADGASVGQHYDDYHTMNTGAVWWKLLSALSLPDLVYVAVDVSGVDDLSGTPRANGCTAADASVPYTSSAIWSWSDTRWLAYLAGAHHLPILGENPGGTPASDLPAIKDLVTSCHLTALQWAWDDNLYANDGSASMGQVQRAFYG
jgi:hypothetical protein